MVSEYPYGAFKVTGILHGLIATGIIIANGHALYRTNAHLDAVNEMFGVEKISKMVGLSTTPIIGQISTTMNIFLGTVIGIAVYFLFIGMIGEAAGSKRKSKSLVNNCKTMYLVVNILSTFFYSWFCGGIAYLFYSMTTSFLDPFGISINLKASIGLIIAELLLSIFSIIICCYCGNPCDELNPSHTGMVLQPRNQYDAAIAPAPNQLQPTSVHVNSGYYQPPNYQETPMRKY